MLTLTCEELSGFKGVKVFLHESGKTLSFADVLRRWQEDSCFRSFFFSVLADAPYAAFRWETPALMEQNTHDDFECVLLEDLHLARQANGASFAEHFLFEPPSGVVEFLTLGRDAALVAPCPSSELECYANIADFSRRAPLVQQHALWQRVGLAMQRRLSHDPVWLNTAGDGVAWLHIRLDSRPKYYVFKPYC
jgi:hypothetical protein